MRNSEEVWGIRERQERSPAGTEAPLDSGWWVSSSSFCVSAAFALEPSRISSQFASGYFVTNLGVRLPLRWRCRSCISPRFVRDSNLSEAVASGYSPGSTGRRRERRRREKDGGLRWSSSARQPPQSSGNPRLQHPMRFCSSSLPMYRAWRDGGGCRALDAVTEHCRIMADQGRNRTSILLHLWACWNS
jgi:hypothetical protein